MKNETQNQRAENLKADAAYIAKLASLGESKECIEGLILALGQKMYNHGHQDHHIQIMQATHAGLEMKLA